MKIRYYLRGLGLGVLVTAMFFMISGKSNQTMSDEMIKARARELGMSESVVLADLSKQEENISLETIEAETETEEITVSEETAETVDTAETVEMSTEEVVEDISEETVEESLEESSEETEETSVSEVVSEEDADSNTSTNTNAEPIVIRVNRGDGSDTVSSRLKEAGLVADAYEYDRYLMANGYDRRISVGEHEIPAGATWEDIAKILCNMR